MIIGFTGTRNGMTEAQHSTVLELLVKLGPKRVVHGDCIGADDDFDDICANLEIPRGIMPCTLEKYRAHCERVGALVLSKPEAPMVRNRRIVSIVDRMIACPPNRERIRSGSGTWATIGFTEKAKKPVYVVFLDGSLRDDEDKVKR